MQLFRLKHNDYDWDVSYTGPDLTQDKFKALCDSLLPEAAKRSVVRQTESEEPCSVYWADILEELDLMLQDKGFTKITLTQADYYGWTVGKPSNELLGEDVVASIQKFNQQREDEFHAQIARFRN